MGLCEVDLGVPHLRLRPVYYGYTLPSKADHDEGSLETPIYQLENHGVSRDLKKVVYGPSVTFKRSSWKDPLD